MLLISRSRSTMAKKYLSLEEAASILPVPPEELVRLREGGEIRGFADRGTWKFKSEDVDEFHRRRQADSNPDVPILEDSTSDSSSSSDGSSKDKAAWVKRTSDSDVRLILDESLREGSDSDPEVVLASLGDSDSDVRLADDPRSIVDSGSDSDVKLVGDDSDSDVTLTSSSSDLKDDSASDSDVRLSAGEGSSSDVGGSSVDELKSSSTSDVALVGKGSSASSDLDSSDSGTSINLRDDSSDSGDSSVLIGDDSGIALDAGSSVVLQGGEGS